MDQLDLDNRFTYHAPSQGKVQIHEDIRLACRVFAETLNDVLPEGREKSLAITHLEEVMMWSNAAIARNNN